MDIGERRQANILVLAPVGRIDYLTSTEFQARLLAAVTSGGADVVVDFSGVEYISSAGLRALMTASRQKPNERRLAVARAPSPPKGPLPPNADRTLRRGDCSDRSIAGLS